MTRIKDLHRTWMAEDEAYRTAYRELGEAFELARALIEARKRAGLSQSELARRMETSQSYIARLESGRVAPSATALARFARATGTRLKIVFEPA